MIEINKIILINSISIPCTVFELRKPRTTTAFVETKKLLTITFIENYETLFSNRSYITFLYFKQRISREFYRILDWKTNKKRKPSWISNYWKRRGKRNSKIEAPCRIIAATSPSAELSRRCLPQPLHKHRNLQHGRRTGSCRSNYENSHTSS